jgi:hypothetical protein
LVENPPDARLHFAKPLPPLPDQGSSLDRVVQLNDAIPVAVVQLLGMADKMTSVAVTHRDEAARMATASGELRPPPGQAPRMPVPRIREGWFWLTLLLAPGFAWLAWRASWEIRTYAIANWWYKGDNGADFLRGLAGMVGFLGSLLVAVAWSIVSIMLPVLAYRGFWALLEYCDAKRVYARAMSHHRHQQDAHDRAEESRLAALAEAKAREQAADVLDVRAEQVRDAVERLSSSRAGLEEVMRRRQAMDLEFEPPPERSATRLRATYGAVPQEAIPPEDERDDPAAPVTVLRVDVVDRLELKQLVKDNREAFYLCPFCNGSVRGRNLVRHVDGQHVGKLPGQVIG